MALSRAADCLLCTPKCVCVCVYVCWCTTSAHSLECLVVLHVCCCVHILYCEEWLRVTAKAKRKMASAYYKLQPASENHHVCNAV